MPGQASNVPGAQAIKIITAGSSPQEQKKAITAISAMHYKIQNEVDMLESMEKQQENTKNHFMTQEMSRHGRKPIQ